MDDRELLKLLNTVEYSEEEINAIEESALEATNSVGEDLYNVKNDKILRKVAFMRLEGKVKESLLEDEKIEYKMIMLQSNYEKEIFRIYAASDWGIPRVYIALFITNKRIFAYKMSKLYEVLEEYCNEIKNLEHLVDLWEKCDTITFEFNDEYTISARAYGEDNRRVFMEAIKYLNEIKGIKIEEYKKVKVSILAWIISLIIVLLSIGIFLSTTNDAIRQIFK
ncbi:hypothetical protein [Clostridium sp. 'White wine YQ']|uniref:hypothetical protein n=1 Tax=Clostridium sp. 'White wine YQ' TaxID=3027474 RepID=UPI0023660B09|nr:hypothetical protein [Clostridium sp. 'White wine YQ']MDD7793491.1 hypothetical protein [Clostridium sp. 'White wine YQ']